MPGATTVFAIPYPCAGENIDCTVFEAWADAIQAAIDSVRALETDAANRPSARASGTNQNPFVANTLTSVVYQTENYDNDNILNLGADSSAFTIQTAGWYLFSSFAEVQHSAGQTSHALSLTQNGTVIYRRKMSQPAVNPNPTPGIQVLGLINCAAADVIRANYLFNGAPSPTLLRATTFCYMVSQA